jgi:PAS domain-containing protein
MSTSAGKHRAHSKAMEVFKSNEKLLLALIENSSDALALVSSEGIFLFVSPQVQRILGYTPQELVGRSTHDLFPPGYPVEVVEQFRSVAETPGLTVTIEHPSNPIDVTHRKICCLPRS